MSRTSNRRRKERKRFVSPSLLLRALQDGGLTPELWALNIALITTSTSPVTGLFPIHDPIGLWTASRGGMAFRRDQLTEMLDALHDARRIVFDRDASFVWLPDALGEAHGILVGGHPAGWRIHVGNDLAEVPSRLIYKGFVTKYALHPYLPNPLPPFRFHGLEIGDWMPHDNTASYRRIAEAVSWVVTDCYKPPKEEEDEAPEHLSETEDTVGAIWTHYQGVFNGTARLTDGIRNRILDRLRDKIERGGEVVSVTPALIKEAIRRYYLSGPTEPKLADVLGSLDKMLYWLTYDPSPTRPSPKKIVETATAAAAWQGYSGAYAARYGTPPVRNAKVNGVLAQLARRVPAAEIEAIAAFYVGHNAAFYTRAGHPVELLLRDAEKLRTEWATGARMTEAQARAVDATQERANIAETLISKARAEKRRPA